MGGGRKRNAFRGLGASAWAAASRARQPSELLIHLCSAQPGLALQKGAFPCSEIAGFFFQVSFLLSKGHYAQDALFLAARPLCEGRKLAGLVTMQIASVKAS